MDIDTDKIDDAVLALFYLNLDGRRSWKSFDWDALSRLHEKGLIENPVNKAKSVELTERGAAASERIFFQLFAKGA